MAALLYSAAIAADVHSTSSSVRVGAQHELFLDNHLIESMRNVRRVTRQGSKHESNPVLKPTQPWEKNMLQLFGSVLRDGDKFRMWYNCGSGIGYADSRDGINWTKPELDVVAIGGKRTNLVYHSRRDGTGEFPWFLEFFGVVRDDAERDASRRYKLGYLSLQPNYSGPREDPLHRTQRRGLGVAGSPDGIHWKNIDSWSTEATCDGMTTWMYDPHSRKYFLFGRTMTTLPEVKESWSKYPWYSKWHRGRSVIRTESVDMLNWSHRDPLSAPLVMTPTLADKPGTEIYSMMVFPYESAYIGLVQHYSAVPDEATLDLRLASSRDSAGFTKVSDHVPFIALGGPGEWDRFTMCSANNPPIVQGDELWFYYSCGAYRHEPYNGPDAGEMTSSIGLARIKRDRFVALEASYDGGEIMTKPLLLKSSRIHVNAISDFGEIRITAVNAAGAVATSKPISVDSTNAAVEWKNAEVPDVSQPLQLRFFVRNAKLFSIWAE